jgi:hypothetical protein
MDHVKTIDEYSIYYLKFLTQQLAFFIINSFRCRRFRKVLLIEGFHSVTKKVVLRTPVDALMFSHAGVSRGAAAEQIGSSLKKVILCLCSNLFSLGTPNLDRGFWATWFLLAIVNRSRLATENDLEWPTGSSELLS